MRDFGRLILTLVFVGAVTGAIGALVGSHLMEAVSLRNTPWQYMVGAFIGSVGGASAVFLLWKQGHFQETDAHGEW